MMTDTTLTLENARKVPLFAGIPDAQLSVLIGRIRTRQVPDHETIFQEGDPGEGLYVVAAGEVVVSKLFDRRRNARRVLASMGPGATFCELTLLDDEPRSVTARAAGDVTLWIISRADYQDLQRQEPAVAAALLDRVLWAMRERLRRSSSELVALYETAPRIELLKRIPLFQKLDEEELGTVSAVLEWSDVPDGAVVFREGDPGDSMYIVESGQVEVSKVIDAAEGTEKTLAVVGPGAFFGDMSLLDSQPRSATVRARGPLRLLTIQRTVWHDLLRDSVELASKLLFGILQTTINRLRRTSSDLVTLYDTGKLVGSITDSAALAEAIVHRACDALDADVGAVVIKSPYVPQPQVKGGIGTGDTFVSASHEDGIVSHTLGLAGPADLTDEVASGSLDLQGLEVSALLAAPLLVPGGVVGAFLVGRKEAGRRFVADDLHLLGSIASQVAAAVENARLREEEQARADHGRHYVGY